MHRLPPNIRSIGGATFLYLVCSIYLIVVLQVSLSFSLFDSLQTPNLLSAPDGFYEISSHMGVKVYQKNYQDGASDFITFVDLQKATLRNLTGTVNGEIIRRKKISEFWHDAIDHNLDDLKARVVMNGTFFDNGQSNTAAIAFGLKTQNRIISYGYGLNEYPDFNKVLTFDSFAGIAQIKAYSRSIFNSLIPDVVGALDAQADKFAIQRLGRTFVGTLDNNQDSKPESILFFSSTSSTQAHANAVLRRFGATEVAMFDGGGSTGLIVEGTAHIKTERALPHAIAIYSNKPEASIVAANNQCLDVSNLLAIPSRWWVRSPILSNCTITMSQRWSLIQGNLRGANHQCLELGRDNANGEGEVQLRKCSQDSAQQWIYEAGRLQATNNKCLDIGKLDKEGNMTVLARSCNDRASQQWRRID